MKFNSQICTSRSQSERLLTMGLKKETADCQHWAYTKDSRGNSIPKRNQKWFTRIGTEKSVQVCGLMNATFIPAWSLHRLIEMMPTYIDVVGDEWTLNVLQGKLIAYTTNENDNFLFAQGAISLYDSIIAAIEWLIQAGHFNKEYLEK